jgi:hypothetical protein
MPRSYYRELPRSVDLKLVKDELVAGRRVVVTAEGGSRLVGKTGTVMGAGATASQIRVLLDGTKNYTTLHARYLELLELIVSSASSPGASSS